MSTFLILAQAAAPATQTGSFIESPAIRFWLTLGVVGLAVAMLSFPSLAGKIREMIRGIVDERLPSIVAELTGKVGESSTPPARVNMSNGTGLNRSTALTTDDVDTLVKQRLGELKVAAPLASDPQLMTWMTQGVSPAKARDNYVQMLEANFPAGSTLGEVQTKTGI